MKPRRATRAQAAALAAVEPLLAQAQARLYGCARPEPTTSEGALITFLFDALLEAQLKRERVQREGGHLEFRLGGQLRYVAPGAP